MRNTRYGLLAGAFAALLLVFLLFFDEGPGDQLTFVAQALGLDSRAESRWVAALLIFALGAILGALFGAFWRRAIPRRRALLGGLAVGALWWAVLFVLLGGVVQRLSFPLYPTLLYLVLSLIYGLVLASIYATLQR